MLMLYIAVSTPGAVLGTPDDNFVAGTAADVASTFFELDLGFMVAAFCIVCCGIVRILFSTPVSYRFWRSRSTGGAAERNTGNCERFGECGNCWIGAGGFGTAVVGVLVVLVALCIPIRMHC